MDYFITVVKYDKKLENGFIKRVSEKYLCSALTITEAVAIATKELEPYISDDFFTSEAKQSKISEVFRGDGCGWWYLVRVGYITTDEKSGKEKRTISEVLVEVPDFQSALKNFMDGMKGTMADFEIVSIAETNIIDVYTTEPQQ